FTDYDDDYDYEGRREPKDVQEEEEDGEDDENQFSKRDILPNSKACTDPNVIYRGRNIVKPIKDVYSSKRCAEICHSVEACEFWVWRGDKFPQKCILKGRLRRRKFRIQKRRAVSGKKEGCPLSVDVDDTPCSVSHDVKVDNVETIKNFFGIKTPEECREKCKENQGLCKTWTWIRLHRREANSGRATKCVLSTVSSEASNYFVHKKGAVTGVYPRKSCYEDLEKKESCTCKSFEEDEYYDLGADYEDYSDYNFGGTGRISNSGEAEDKASSSCQRKKEYQHCPLQKEQPTEEVTTGEKLKDDEVCLEYGVNYNGGATYKMLQDIPSAELCRAKCTGICKYWTWKSKRSH
ncbi:Uncharacterized protein FKW44_002159, partial [Caligus rogercresseyi]